jgi:hypothetical protein
MFFKHILYREISALNAPALVPGLLPRALPSPPRGRWLI